MDSFLQASKGALIKNLNFPELGSGINEKLFSQEVNAKSEENEDIINDKIYSIQQAKLLAEEDHKRSLAETKKMKVLENIKLLREQFEDLKNKNNEKDEFTKLKVIIIIIYF